MNPKVSVIIPVYNSEKFISETLDSVLSQTFSDYEIIVVDDGSVDRTEDLIKNYQSKYPDKIKYIYQENQGPSVARNNGILNSHGSYVAFLDHDDLWLPEKLELQVAYMDVHPNLGFTFTEAYAIDEVGNIFNHWKHDCTINTFDNLYDRDFIHTLTVMVCRNCLARIGLFDSSLIGAQDYDLWLRLAKVFLSAPITLPLAKYRIHQGNLSKNLAQSLRDHLAIISKKEIINGVTKKRQRIAKAKQYIYFALKYRKINKFFEAAKCYFMALLEFPFIGAYYWRKKWEGSFPMLPYRIMKMYLICLRCFFTGLKNLKVTNTRFKNY